MNLELEINAVLLALLINDIGIGKAKEELLKVAKQYAKEYAETMWRQGIGWAIAEACVSLDRGEDIRLKPMPDIIEEAMKDFNLIPPKGDEG